MDAYRDPHRKERKDINTITFSIASLQFSVNSSHWMNLPGNQKTRRLSNRAWQEEGQGISLKTKQKTDTHQILRVLTRAGP